MCDIDIRCRGSEAGPKCLPIDYSTGSRLLGYVTVKLRDTCDRYYQRFPAFVYTHYVSLSSEAPAFSNATQYLSGIITPAVNIF